MAADRCVADQLASKWGSADELRGRSSARFSPRARDSEFVLRGVKSCKRDSRSLAERDDFERVFMICSDNIVRVHNVLIVIENNL